MPRLLCIVLAFAVGLAPSLLAAQVRPHRAEYQLRLGAALNAPRIGTAVQELTQDCAGWRLRREIVTEIAITPAWKISVTSRLDGEETRGGGVFHYRATQIQNGAERQTSGRVQRRGEEVRAEIVYPTGPAQFMLPPPTLMPVSAMAHMIDRLRAGAAAFPALAFDAEVISDAFLVDVTELAPESIRAARPSNTAAPTPPGKSWPVSMSFTRGRDQQQRPMFTVNTLVFDTGVLDRLTVDTGLVSVTADLQTLKMHPLPTCPHS